MKALTLTNAIKKKSKDPEFKKLYDRELKINKIVTMIVKQRRPEK